MVRPGRPSVGQSSATPQDGVFMYAQQLLDLVRNARATGSNSKSTHPKSGFARLCSDYTNLGGKPFKCSETIIDVQAWLRTCNRIFSRMNLIDLHRVQVASSILQERALDWYKLLISEINEVDLTWEKFREHFELKFVPEAEKVTLACRFIDLA